MQADYARLSGSSWNGTTTPSPSYRSTFEREGDAGSLVSWRSVNTPDNNVRLSPPPPPHPLPPVPLHHSGGSGTPTTLRTSVESGVDPTRLLRLNYRGDSVLTVSPLRYEVRSRWFQIIILFTHLTTGCRGPDPRQLFDPRFLADPHQRRCATAQQRENETAP
jgi:hypothetical protein